MLEKQIEKKVKDFAIARGWYVRKFVTPANRAAPDDIFMKSGFVFWIEFKATGKEATDLQKEEHKKMRSYGGIVYVCDDICMGKVILERMELFT